MITLVKTTTAGKIQKKYDCIHGLVVNVFVDTILFSFALDKWSG